MGLVHVKGLIGRAVEELEELEFLVDTRVASTRRSITLPATDSNFLAEYRLA